MFIKMYHAYLIIILSKLSTSIKCEHVLLWSDEFNNKDLDLENWFIKSNDFNCESKFQVQYLVNPTDKNINQNNSANGERAATPRITIK